MKKKPNILLLSSAYYTLMILLLGLLSTSCVKNSTTGGDTAVQAQEQAHPTGDDKASIQFKQTNLQDRPHEINREVVATFNLQDITKLQDWKLQVQVQVIPEGVVGASTIDCTGELLKKDATTPSSNITSTLYIYRFADNISNENKPLIAAFTLKPAEGVSEMIATFQLVKNNLPIGEPCTVTWQAAPRMEWIEIADDQEVKDNESFTMGLTNVGDRIMNTNEVTIKLSSEKALKLVNESGSFTECTLASLLDPHASQQITKNDSVKFSVRIVGEGVEGTESPATLEAWYKQEKLAEKKIKLVKDYTMLLKLDTTASKSVALLGFGPFNIAVKNMGTHTIDLNKVGVKVESKAKFFINNHSVEETDKKSLAQVLGVESLAENCTIDLPLRLQPVNTRNHAEVEITLYELENPMQIVDQLCTAWKSGIAIKIQEKKGLTFIVNERQVNATVELENLGQKISLDHLVVKVKTKDKMESAITTETFGSKESLKQFEVVHYDIQLTGPINRTEDITATIKAYYKDKDKDIAIFLGKCKIKWEKKK